jgi:Lambda phage tail tube protein, TTP
MSHALRSQNSTIAWGGAAPTADPLTASAIATAASSATWGVLEEAVEIKPSGQKVDEIDVTHLQSLAKEFVLGLEDSGSVDVTMNFTGGKYQQQMFVEKANKTLSIYQIVLGAQLTQPASFTFCAYCVKAETPDAKVNGKIELSVSLRISGPVSIGWGSLANPTI